MTEGVAVKLRSSGVSWREIDGEMVILDLVSSRYLTTNRTGATLMKLLTADRTLDELARELAAEFDIPHTRAVADTEQFVLLLQKNELLETNELGAG